MKTRRAVEGRSAVSTKSGFLVLALVGSLVAFGVVAGTTTAQEATALAGIQIFFKMDPRLSGGTYQGERWFSPFKFTSAVQGGTVGTVDIRVRGIDARGRPLHITPEWTASDPGMVEVTSGQAGEFRITVKRIGESTLKVTLLKLSKELVVKAQPVGKGVQVEITQAASENSRTDMTSVNRRGSSGVVSNRAYNNKIQDTRPVPARAMSNFITTRYLTAYAWS